MSTRMNIPPKPSAIIERLEAHGYPAYAVGGCVRDALLGLEAHDWDITTAALPQQVMDVFADCTTVPVGLQHGTVTVIYKGQSFEITTFRVDGEYTDSRHPESVSFTPSLEEDLARRDFTINAIAWHPTRGIVDPFGGQDDLARNILRCVGDPTRRFAEDTLRILRALRFAAVYGFRIEETTDYAARLFAPRLSFVSAERIRTELFKLLCGDHAATVLDKFSDILNCILPEVTFTPITLQTLTRAPRDIPCRLAILLQNFDANSILRRLKTDNTTIAQVDAILTALSLPPTTDFVQLKKRLRVYSVDTLQRAACIHIAVGEDSEEWEHSIDALNRLVDTHPCVSVDMLQINGNHLKTLGLEGKAIGETLEALLTAVIEERCENQSDALLAYIQKIRT